jgi:hypothetical protein
VSLSSHLDGTGDFPLAYRERVEDLCQTLVAHGSLGLLLIDTSALVQIEHQYGGPSPRPTSARCAG